MVALVLGRNRAELEQSRFPRGSRVFAGICGLVAKSFRCVLCKHKHL